MHLPFRTYEIIACKHENRVLTKKKIKVINLILKKVVIRCKHLPIGVKFITVYN